MRPKPSITRTEAIRIAVQTRLSAKFTATTDAKKSEQGALVEYYAVPDQRLLWVDENGLTERGKAVMAEIEKADEYGLRASDYALPSADGFNSSDANATDWLADAEIKISFAVLGYARDARGGRIEPARLSPNLDPELALPNPSEVIESIAIRSDPAAYLRSFQPDQPQFEVLRQKLIELRGGKVETAKPVVTIPDGPVLKLGIEHEQVALLRKRLDMPSENRGRHASRRDEVRRDGPRGRAPLPARPWRRSRRHGRRRHAAAAQRRQQPHAVGSPARIRAVLINMERWRWLPHDLGAFYVTVNIPEFMLRVVEDDKPLFTTRVVVGKTDKQTPIFSNEMQDDRVRSVLERADLDQDRGDQALSQGRGRLVLRRRRLEHRGLPAPRPARQDMPDGRSIPAPSTGTGFDIRNTEIYQPPGPGNVLGRVKFVFPNKHDVYMHDTPQKFLFAKPGPGREPRLHAGAKPRSACRSPPEARSGLEPGADDVGHRDRLRPARCRCGRGFPCTSPISRLKLTMTGRSQPTGISTVTTPAWRPRFGSSPVNNLGKSC